MARGAAGRDAGMVEARTKKTERVLVTCLARRLSYNMISWLSGGSRPVMTTCAGRGCERVIDPDVLPSEGRMAPFALNA